MLAGCCPTSPRPQALLALILLTEARGPGPDRRRRATWCCSPTRTAPGGTARSIRRGSPCATAALRHPRRGRFALQAAVAGLHAVAPTWADTDWAQIVTTYDALMRTWPSPVVALNRAAARSRLPGADLAAVLREIDDLALDGYPYLPAARADVLARLGRAEEAAAAYAEALALTTNPVERRYLRA